jgi:hypothetical protein
MKVTLTNTSKIVELELRGSVLPARVWEGHTEAGVPVIAFITRIAAERDQDLAEFERDLHEVAPPSAVVQAWPVRMMLD